MRAQSISMVSLHLPTIPFSLHGMFCPHHPNAYNVLMQRCCPSRFTPRNRRQESLSMEWVRKRLKNIIAIQCSASSVRRKDGSDTFRELRSLRKRWGSCAPSSRRRDGTRLKRKNAARALAIWYLETHPMRVERRENLPSYTTRFDGECPESRNRPQQVGAMQLSISSSLSIGICG